MVSSTLAVRPPLAGSQGAPPQEPHRTRKRRIRPVAHFQPVTSPPDPQAVTLAVGETVEVLLHGGGISGTNLASPGSASPRQEVIVSRPLVDGGLGEAVASVREVVRAAGYAGFDLAICCGALPISICVRRTTASDFQTAAALTASAPAPA